ncbi:MAG TPA: ATP synthase F0 subunit B, partial [Rhizomicrobium sp.]
MTIDWWTLGLEAVNVAVLVWLLARFFWRPVSAMIAERQVAAGKDLAEAAAKQAEAEKALAEVAATRAGLAKEREAMLVAAAAEADKERAARLEKTTQEIAAQHAAAKAAISKQQETALVTWRGHAATLAVEIAARLLKRLEGPALHKVFLDELLQEIGG